MSFDNIITIRINDKFSSNTVKIPIHLHNTIKFVNNQKELLQNGKKINIIILFF